MNSIIRNQKLIYQLVCLFSSYKLNLTAYSLGRQTSFDNNLIISNDTFAFDNSLCESNDDIQSTNSTQQSKPPPIPPRVPRTSNGSNKSPSPS